VTTEDLHQLVALIDEYGSQTVADLLVAFGYAREPQEAEESVEQTKEEQGTEGEEEQP